MRRLSLAVTVFAVLTTLPAISPIVGPFAGLRAASAAPVVSVKARTAIEIDPIRRDLNGIVVRGRLVDKISRAPIGWVDLTVQLDHQQRPVVTDADGSFEARFAVAGGRHDLAIEFRGDLHHDPSRHEIANFDVTKNPITLSLRLSRSVADYGVDPLTIFLEARTDLGPAESLQDIRLALGPETDDTADLPVLGTIRTDVDGRASLELSADQLGAPGRKRVFVRYPGNDAYDAAEAQTSFSVKSDTAITFTVRSLDLAYEDRFEGHGIVTDGRGDGVAGGAVSLMVASRHIAATATDETGRYAFKISVSELGSGKFSVQSVFTPSKVWHRGSRSEPAAVTIAQPQPVPISYTIAAFAATALALLAFVGMRTRPWESWLARWRAQRADGDEDRDAAPESDDAELKTGLSLARPSLVSTLRRTKDQGFSGAVRNAVTHRPVGAARVTMSSAGSTSSVDHSSRHQQPSGAERAEHSLEADGAGRFAFDMLAMGRWQVRISAYGYVTESFTVSVPHRGELRGARVDLLPVRERIFALYGRAARPLLPNAAHWGVWSPRQIFDHVRKSRARSSEFAALTDFVEETYFSQRTPEEELIQEARERIARAAAELDADSPDREKGGPTSKDPA